VFEEVIGNSDEEVPGEWKPLPFSALIVDTFSTFEYALDDLIVKGFEGHAMFEVIVTHAVEILSGGVGLDRWEEVCDPMCDRFEGGGEWLVALSACEELVVGDGFGVSFPS
jgi:hypothetical protein